MRLRSQALAGILVLFIAQCVAAVDLGIRLEATDIDANPITEVSVGDTFLLHAFVQDLRNSPHGVFAAYFDLGYEPTIVSQSEAITHGSDFQQFKSGDSSTPGMIDNAGGTEGFELLGGDEFLLISVPFNADSPGVVNFTSAFADSSPGNDVLFMGPFGENDAIRGSSAEQNPTNPLDVSQDDFVSPLDALLVVNNLNVGGSRPIEGETPPPFLDVDGDAIYSTHDALVVINELNGFGLVPSDPAGADQISFGSATVRVVPEPTAWLLLITAFAALPRVRRTRCTA